MNSETIYLNKLREIAQEQSNLTGITHYIVIPNDKNLAYGLLFSDSRSVMALIYNLKNAAIVEIFRKDSSLISMPAQDYWKSCL